MTDVQILICSSLGPKIDEKGDFLLRFVYHETLMATFKSLGVEPPKSADFDNMKADYKKHQAYGIVASAIHLSNKKSPGGVASAKQKKVEKRVFQSKIIGGVVGKGDPKVYEVAAPSSRIKSLIEKLVD